MPDSDIGLRLGVICIVGPDGSRHGGAIAETPVESGTMLQ